MSEKTPYAAVDRVRDSGDAQSLRAGPRREGVQQYGPGHQAARRGQRRRPPRPPRPAQQLHRLLLDETGVFSTKAAITLDRKVRESDDRCGTSTTHSTRQSSRSSRFPTIAHSKSLANLIACPTTSSDRPGCDPHARLRSRRGTAADARTRFTPLRETLATARDVTISSVAR